VCDVDVDVLKAAEIAAWRWKLEVVSEFSLLENVVVLFSHPSCRGEKCIDTLGVS
jgi:hypothetical protein